MLLLLGWSARAEEISQSRGERGRPSGSKTDCLSNGQIWALSVLSLWAVCPSRQKRLELELRDLRPRLRPWLCPMSILSWRGDRTLPVFPLSKQYSVHISPKWRNCHTRKIGSLGVDQIRARKEASSGLMLESELAAGSLPAAPLLLHLWPRHSEQTATTTCCCRRPMQAMITFISSPSSQLLTLPASLFYYSFASHFISVSCRGKEREKFSNREKRWKRHSPQMQPWHQSGYWLYFLIALARIFLIRKLSCWFQTY